MTTLSWSNFFLEVITIPEHIRSEIGIQRMVIMKVALLLEKIVRALNGSRMKMQRRLQDTSIHTLETEILNNDQHE